MNDLFSYDPLPFIHRMYMTALTRYGIEKAFSNIRKMKEDQLAQGLGRNYADCVIGLNLSKALTRRIKLESPDLRRGFSLGRVQTPVLTFITNSTLSEIREEEYSLSYKYCILEDAVIELYDTDINPGVYRVVDVREKIEEIEQARSLPNYNDVVLELSDKISSEIIDSALEDLHLKGLITYPRTHSNYCSDPHELYLSYLEMSNWKLINTEVFKFEYSPSIKIRGEKQPIFLTVDGIRERENLTGVERLVADRIFQMMILTFAPPIKVLTREIVLETGDTIQVGRKIIDGVNVSFEREFEYKFGDTVTIIERREKTRGYRHHFEFPEDKRVISWMVSKNIGTEATRTQYIPKLKERGYLDRGGLPTRLGYSIVSLFSRLIDVELTYKLEEKLNSLSSLHELSVFRSEINRMTIEMYNTVMSADLSDLYPTCPKCHKRMKFAERGRALFAVCRCGYELLLSR